MLRSVVALAFAASAPTHTLPRAFRTTRGASASVWAGGLLRSGRSSSDPLAQATIISRRIDRGTASPTHAIRTERMPPRVALRFKRTTFRVRGRRVLRTVHESPGAHEGNKGPTSYSNVSLFNAHVSLTNVDVPLESAECLLPLLLGALPGQLRTRQAPAGCPPSKSWGD